MHHAEAVAEPRRSNLREDEMAEARLADVTQPLHQRIVNEPSFHARETNVPVNWISDPPPVRHLADSNPRALD